MGRELRKVPEGWVHPQTAKGYVPLRDGYEKRVAEWDEENRQWELGFRWHYGSDTFVEKTDEYKGTYSEWDGERPRRVDYMLAGVPEDKRTHFMMYEDTTEGTPISPAFDTPEELCHWLADTGASAFGGESASYEWWMGVCKNTQFTGLILELGTKYFGLAPVEAAE